MYINASANTSLAHHMLVCAPPPPRCVSASALVRLHSGPAKSIIGKREFLTTARKSAAQTRPTDNSIRKFDGGKHLEVKLAKQNNIDFRTDSVSSSKDGNLCLIPLSRGRERSCNCKHLNAIVTPSSGEGDFNSFRLTLPGKTLENLPAKFGSFSLSNLIFLSLSLSYFFLVCQFRPLMTS